MIHIYSCKDKYLYEIIEDYKETDSKEEKNEIFNSFCSSIWSSSNHRRKYVKTIHFTVRKDLLDTELGRVFDTWSSIEYTYYKSMTKEQNWCSLIRQKINNIYIRYFDKDVILAKEYIDLLKLPKQMYYDWISGTEMDAGLVTDIIDDAIDKSLKVKEHLKKEKMEISWDNYKKVIEEFLLKCFDNCRLTCDYEDKSSVSSMYDFFTEDHFYVKYFNRCLDGSIKDYEKRYYNLPQSSRIGYKKCSLCGNMYQLKSKHDYSSKYCKLCKREMLLEKYSKYNKKRTTTKPNPL